MLRHVFAPALPGWRERTAGVRMSLFDELKRRKVFRVGVGYLVVGWLLIQVASTVAPQLNLPEWAPRLITFVIMLGFPIALVLAWMLDVTPEGIKVDGAPAGNKRVIAAAVVLAALAVGWYWKTRPLSLAGEGGADAHSIAVLPFVNMSDDKSNEYFSDGISEEILNVLARMSGLHVAARTSSFSFRKQEQEIPTIARELKVRMVLEGSVRKQGDRVRVTAQLIDASDGYHVWSQTYDRDLKDIFAIQDEIAGAIAQELKVKLDAAHAAGVTVADTTDLAAYDLYLKGIALWQARGDKNLHEAEKLLREAIARDPGYAKAWSGLGLVHAILPEWSTDSLAEARVKAREAAEQALALDPGLPEPFAVLGYVAASELRFSAARAMFKRSVTIAPSYATGWQWSGETLFDEGDIPAALEMVRKAASLDPKSSIVNSVLASILVEAGRDDEALGLCGSIVAVDTEWCPLLRFDVAIARKDYAAARTALVGAAKERGSEALALFNAQMDALDGKGDIDAIAKRTLELVDGQMDPAGLTPLGAYDAIFWFIALGRNDLAVERYARSVRVNPGVSRQMAFDTHLVVLHCEPKFLEILRSLKVDEPHLAAACPKTH
jgi:TolB-like protein/Tfp pilus assembly protein PilF